MNTFTAVKLLIINAKSVPMSDFFPPTYIWGGNDTGFCRLPWFGLPHECGVGEPLAVKDIHRSSPPCFYAS